MSAEKPTAGPRGTPALGEPADALAFAQTSALRFQSGGALRSGAVYVERPADAELLDTLLLGEFAYVLAPRQIGKSSLRAQAARRLRDKGILCATIDLTQIGASEVTMEQWYFGLIEGIANDLGLPDPAPTWHTAEPQSAVHRFSKFLHSEVLAQTNQRIVVFIDEIDAILRLPFDASDFFAAIRAVYNARAIDPGFERLTFCLLGVTTPLELTCDPLRTPFNVGRGIRLEDFCLEEMQRTFIPAMQSFVENPQDWLAAIFHWTHGHPYMSQRLCEAMTRRRLHKEPRSAVDELVQELFLARGRIEELCLANAQERFVNSAHARPLVARMLRIYHQLLEKEVVPAVGNDPAQLELRLCGLASDRADHGQRLLFVRNRIFASVFDDAWVRECETWRVFGESFESWLAAGKNPNFLLKGQTLDAVVSWARSREDLLPEEREFMTAGMEAGKREQEAFLLATEQAHQEQTLRQRAEWRARCLGFLVLLLLIAFGVALL